MKKRLLLSFLVLSGVTILGQDGQQAGYQDKVAMIQGYAQLAASIVQKSYSLFHKEPVIYDLQKDVLDIPFKNMVYSTTSVIEQLFSDANCHDNPHLQIKAIILLCRMPVPDWYFKNFNKGMDQLYQTCFDEVGNFKDVGFVGDIRMMFREYCRKTPSCWQHVAKISPWWYRKKKPYGIYTKYYALTCTEYNEDLLRMIAADPEQDLAYLQYLMAKYQSAPALRIYQAHVAEFVKHDFYDQLASKDKNL